MSNHPSLAMLMLCFAMHGTNFNNMKNFHLNSNTKPISDVCAVCDTRNGYKTEKKNWFNLLLYIFFINRRKKVMTFKHDNFMNFINPKQNWFSANEHFYTQEKSNNQLPRKRANQQMIVISIYVFLFLFLLSLYVCLCVNLLSFCKWHLFSWNEQPSERAISDVNCPFKLLQLFVGLGEKKSGKASWKDFF